MHKFEFRLEPVLKQREAREEQAALEQARALEEYNRKLRRLTEARENLARAMQMDNLVDPFDLYNRLFYCNAMAKEIKTREASLYQADKKLQYRRKNLIKAMQERSVLENLKEKQSKIYQAGVKKQEQKEIDEIALMLYTHKTSVRQIDMEY